MIAAKSLAVFIAAAALVGCAGAGFAQSQGDEARRSHRHQDGGHSLDCRIQARRNDPAPYPSRRVLEGATVEAPDGKQIELKTGSGSIKSTRRAACRLQGRRRQAVENRHRSHRRQRRAALRRPAEVDRGSLEHDLGEHDLGEHNLGEHDLGKSKPAFRKDHAPT